MPDIPAADTQPHREHRAVTQRQVPLTLRQALTEEYEELRGDSPRPPEPAPNGAQGVAACNLVFDAVHRLETPLSALCISGGGIRSATFALGAVQGLAQHGLLRELDYVSTVSGGGYLGAWLSCWIKRDGIDKVIEGLQPDAPQPGPGEADPIQHLREYNNYLSPRLGFLSVDTWTLTATVLRNITLNWLVLVPLLMFVLMLPRLLFSIDKLGLPGESAWVRLGLPGLMAVLFTYGGTFTLRHLPGLGGRDHSQGEFLLHCILPLATGAVTFSVYSSYRVVALQQAALGMLIPCVAGWFLYLLVCGKPLQERVELIFGPMSLAIVLMGLSIGGGAALLQQLRPPLRTWAEWVTFGPLLLFLGLYFAVSIFVGLSSRTLKEYDREWLARCSAWILLPAVGWAAICALVLLAPKAALTWSIWGKSALAATGALSGWLGTLRGSTTPGKGEKKSVVETARGKLVNLAPLVFAGIFSVGVALLTNKVLHASGAVMNRNSIAWTDHDLILENTPWYFVLGAAAFFLAISWLMARYININTFSLHGMYRDRLIRAFLGASNAERRTGQSAGSERANRKPLSSFTGFAESDNFGMWELAKQRPLHVVNVALNLVAGQRLAWQQRKAESFTISPLHCGNFELGYRRAREFGGPKGISLGTAMATSGAAASPNMGSYSSPAVGFLMTLFNARLGNWLGNPADTGKDTWKETGPRSAIRSIVKEALGLTDNRSEYIYLSDGGHFENLALYEMVLRRCRSIIVLDSSCDPELTCEDLGNAIRKIRIDLRVPIAFPEAAVRAVREGRKRAVIATIRYSAVDGPVPDGKLIYLKPMLMGNEPPDLGTYAKANPTFPHQSTADQWFNESQTESYRMLGLHTIQEVFRGWPPRPASAAAGPSSGINGLGAHVEREYLGSEPPASGSTMVARAAH